MNHDTRTNYLMKYTSTLPWYESRRLVKYIYTGNWEFINSGRWNFAVDYIGKNHITNLGVIRKRKVGSGLLYSDRDFIGVVTILDTHKWTTS